MEEYLFHHWNYSRNINYLKPQKEPVMTPYNINLAENIPVEEASLARITRSIFEQQVGHSVVPLPPKTKDLEFPPNRRENFDHQTGLRGMRPYALHAQRLTAED